MEESLVEAEASSEGMVSDAGGTEADTSAAPERAETFELRSGVLVIIDQFMVGNRQLLIRLIGSYPTEDELASGSADLAHIIEMYGGTLVRMSPGTYRVLRDAEQSRIVICRVDSLSSDGAVSEQDAAELDRQIEEKAATPPIGRVLVDTRCMVLMDVTLFADSSLLEQYQRHRDEKEDKKARDLLRERGAAVRYGFKRYGDELGVFELAQDRIGLWPEASS